MKYAVIYNDVSKVVEADDAKTAVKEFVKAMIARSAYLYGDAIKYSYSGSIWVHEMDDGEEFKVIGSVNIEVKKEIDPLEDNVDEVAESIVPRQRRKITDAPQA